MERNGEPTRVLIAGGGVAALEAALELRALAAERVSVELVASEREFTYRPLAVAEPFRVGEVRRFPLEPLVEAAGATFRQGLITAVDPYRHVVTTGEGEQLPYDLLLLALGARTCEAVPGALTFRGPEDVSAFSGLLDEALAGEIRSIVFAMPAGAGWPLPLYELALLTGTYLADRGGTEFSLTLVTPEEGALAVFGSAASETVRELFEIRRIDLRARTTPLAFEAGMLTVVPGDRIEAERVVALPRLEGPRLPGVPHDPQGFVPTDDFGQVAGEVDLYAAGDITQFPLKQGGIATQQADSVAAAIAARAGAPVEPSPFRPVLRGLLLTGMVPRFLRAEPGTAVSVADTEALWWPPAKIVGHRLAPFLAEHLGLPRSAPESAVGEAVAVEVELDPALRTG